MSNECKSVWHDLADHADTLEMLIEKETPLEEEARTLLEELEQRDLLSR